MEPSSLVRATDQLIEIGLVELREDAIDRRAKTLHLTDEGARRAGMEEALIPFRRELLADIAEEDVHACLRVLHGMNAANHQHAPGRKHS